MADVIDIRGEGDPATMGSPVATAESESEFDELGGVAEFEAESAADIPDPTIDDAPLELGAPTVAAALEALLLLADEPQPALLLAEIIGRPEVEVEETLAELAMQYLADGRGIELRRVDTGWRFYTATVCRDLITRYVTDGRQARLSQAALETLSIVAYRQPVSRAQVGAIRGVNPDGVIKTLQARGLITEASHEGDVGITRFVTTDYFLDRMGLDSLTELPPIADHLPDLGSLDDLIG